MHEQVNSMSIRLLVADDHEVVRTGLKSILEGTDIEVIAEAKGGDEAVRLTMEENPDIVIMDIRMPGGDGLTALGRIKLEKPATPVLMFSTYDNPTYVARSVALGASGYLLKNAGCQKVIESIRKVASASAVAAPAARTPVARSLSHLTLAFHHDVVPTLRRSDLGELHRPFSGGWVIAVSQQLREAGRRSGSMSPSPSLQ